MVSLLLLRLLFRLFFLTFGVLVLLGMGMLTGLKDEEPNPMSATEDSKLTERGFPLLESQTRERGFLSERVTSPVVREIGFLPERVI
ncbi:hypothetical protein A2U01_0040402, partial [Trifolium medium]|nr:hypothetical protein [Trifolium medium]